MERDYREESWWPQPLLTVRWYLTDSDRFEISTRSVGGEEKSQPQKIDSFSSGACLNPGTSFHITKFKFCMSLHGFAFKDGTKPQRSGLDLHLFSVAVMVYRNLQKNAETSGKSETKFSYFTVLQKDLHLFFFSTSFIDRYSCLFYTSDCLVYMFLYFFHFQLQFLFKMSRNSFLKAIIFAKKDKLQEDKNDKAKREDLG